MYHPRDIIDLIAGNVRKTRNPFAIPKFALNYWWKRAQLPQKGDHLLFTGLMYQFAPYIEASTQYLARFEDTPWADYLPYGKFMPKLLSGIGLAAITPGKEKRRFNQMLRDMAALLVRSKVDFYYYPELDDYSGVLLYDLGDQEGFEAHMAYVADNLKRNGVKKLITVDPHTTYAMKVLLPEVTGERFEVRTYFEMLDLSSRNGHRKIALHDPCFYGRYLELSDVPRQVLASVDIECAPLRDAGLFTHCCGGPAESISPKLAGDVGERRMAQLTAPAEPIVAMCPICLGNLRKTGADVADLSTVLARQTA